jgi:hypothetical protein
LQDEAPGADGEPALLEPLIQRVEMSGVQGAERHVPDRILQDVRRDDPPVALERQGSQLTTDRRQPFALKEQAEWLLARLDVAALVCLDDDSR